MRTPQRHLDASFTESFLNLHAITQKPFFSNFTDLHAMEPFEWYNVKSTVFVSTQRPDRMPKQKRA